MTTVFKNKVFRAFFIGLAVFAVFAASDAAGLFDFLEHKTYDMRIKTTAGLRMPSEEIIVVLLDQDSLDRAQKERGWSWPWPRAAYGDIVRFFEKGDAASVVFDVMFTEPSIYGSSDDEKFAEAEKSYKRTVQTIFFGHQYGNVKEWPSNLQPEKLHIEGYTQADLGSISAEQPALFPIKTIAEAAGTFGNVTSITDSDGVIRRSRLFFPLGSMPIPSLGISSLSFDEDHQQLSFNKKNMTVTYGGKTLKVDKDNALNLRYRENLDKYVPYSAYDILDSWETVKKGGIPLLEPEMFAGKYVFFGFYAPGLFDIAPTPIDTKYPGVGVHITMLDNFLQDDFITNASSSVSFIILLLCSLAGVGIVNFSQNLKFSQRTNLIFSIILLLLGASVYLAAAFGMFIAGVSLHIAAPLTAVFISFFTAILVNYNTEGKQRRYLKAAFRQYLSPVVIEQLIANPEKLKLGGERREISIFFSDVQGFTTISEKLSPEDLTSLLNDYLTAMSDIILQSGGTIDKYEGDAIIAFWNAPTAQDDHARKALEAAIKCQQVLSQMRDELTQRAGVPMYMRIGLNTGTAVVGNMGSRNRFDYTMLGDSVNLAARLEGQNKQFGTYTMCTKAMLEAARSKGCTVNVRELARVAVVGKKEPVTIYEPFDDEGWIRVQPYLETFEKARALFYEGSFAAALALFESIQKDDRPAYFYAEKCRALIADPPSDWNGVWVATSK